MRVAFNFNGLIKLEKNNFNNIEAVKISAVFEVYSTNSSSTDTRHSQILSKMSVKVAS